MKRVITIVILTLILGLAACSPAEAPDPTTEPPTPLPSATASPEPTATFTAIPPTATPTETPPPTATETPSDPLADYPTAGYGPAKFPENVNPLTGLPVSDPQILDRRPVAAKISNFPRAARPQWGLAAADLVFEYYQEYGATRFHVIFYGQDASKVGPIRSARFPDTHLIRAYKSVFAFGSADYRVRWQLYSADFANRLASVSDTPCPPTVAYPTCRIEPDGWNHLMTDTAILSQHFSEQGVSNGRQYLDGMRFDKAIPPEGKPANSVIVRFSGDSYNKWEYDALTHKYTRYADAALDSGEGETFEMLTDRANGQPITADNVVIIFAPYSFYSRDPEIIEIDLIGSGKAYIFRDGQMYEAIWVRTTAEEIISIAYADGSRFPMRPGNTWFEIVGESSPTPQSDTDWRVQFQTP